MITISLLFARFYKRKIISHVFLRQPCSIFRILEYLTIPDLLSLFRTI